MNGIKSAVLNLQHDFIGFHVSLSGIEKVAVAFSVASLYFIFIYIVGRPIQHKLSRDKDPFLACGLGYIVYGTGICLLGLFSLLYPLVFWIYTASILCVAVFYLLFLKETFPFPKRFVVKKNRFFFLLLVGFILMSSLRLLPPDIAADSYDYHTSYPRLYVQNHTMELPPRGNEQFIAIPQLGEMPYVATTFLGTSEAPRYIHFGFLLLCLSFLFQFLKREKGKYIGVFLLLSSPIVLHIAPASYSDFPALFCFLLALYVFTKNKLRKNIFLSGLLFGGALATKIWMLALFPSFIIFLFLQRKNYKSFVKEGLIFVFSSLLIVCIWYFRSFLLAGDPFFHNNTVGSVNSNPPSREFFHYSLASLKALVLDYSILTIPLLLISFFIPKAKDLFRQKQLLFAFLSVGLYFFLSPDFYGRYFFPGFIGCVIIISSILPTIIEKVMLMRFIANVGFSMLLLYFGINTLLMLPYGLGWANKDAYLTRAFAGDNATYYDFNHRFSARIKSTETIATYGIYGYYYPRFSYKNVYYYFHSAPEKNSFKELTSQGITKLLIRGGDIGYFCAQTHINNCSNTGYQLVAEFPTAKQYLYVLQ